MDFSFCYFAVMELHWKPHEYNDLPPREKNLVRAFILENIKQRDEARQKTK